MLRRFCSSAAPPFLSLCALLILAWPGQAQVFNDRTHSVYVESPSVRVPSTLPTYMTSINYPLINGSYATWPYAAPLELNGGSGGPSSLPSIAMRPTPVVTKAYEPYLGAPAMAALITVDLPVNADLWFQDMKVPGTGSHRLFSSPDLNPMKAYVYDVRAVWREGENMITQKQRILVRSGDRLTVSFPQATVAPSMLPTPTAEPVPPPPSSSMLPRSSSVTPSMLPSAPKNEPAPMDPFRPIKFR